MVAAEANAEESGPSPLREKAAGEDAAKAALQVIATMEEATTAAMRACQRAHSPTTHSLATLRRITATASPTDVAAYHARVWSVRRNQVRGPLMAKKAKMQCAAARAANCPGR